MAELGVSSTVSADVSRVAAAIPTDGINITAPIRMQRAIPEPL
jgi:hypothetical protein